MSNIEKDMELLPRQSNLENCIFGNIQLDNNSMHKDSSFNQLIKLVKILLIDNDTCIY